MLLANISLALHRFQPLLKTGLLPTFSETSVQNHIEGTLLEHMNVVDSMTAGTPLADLSSLDELVRATWPDPAQQKLFGHASELWNHIFFFDTLCLHREQPPMSEFMSDLIFTHFQGPERFFWQFAAHGSAIQGSGWTWLLSREGDLEIYNSFNRNTALVHPNSTPILALDMFEHSYYLDHGARKDLYARDFWANVNWSKVEDRYRASLAPQQRVSQ